MNFLFWGIAFTMVLVATLLVVLPLVRNRQTVSKPLVMMGLLVPLIALGIYSGIGSPGMVAAETGHTYAGKSPDRVAPASNGGKPAGSVASLVDGLAERLQREADDAGGWLLLARSYELLGRHQDASFAYERATALGRTDPKLEKSLSLAGDLTAQSAESPQVAIRGRVSVDQAADRIVEDTDTVFIIVKASSDQRMPIVAIRKSAADLPIDFLLTDKQAMVPGTSLADFDELFVIARVSRSGLANDAVAGLEIEGKFVSPFADDFVELTVSPSGMINSDAEVPAE